MNKIYVKLLFIFVIICMVTLIKETKKTEENPKENIVSVTTKEGVLKLPIDDYLIGVIAGEMPASFEMEALKAQAVASRTFVLARKLKVDNTTKTQVYLSDETMRKNWKDDYENKKKKIIEAIQATKDEVMVYNNQYISALFFSSSNGRTVDCEDYFVGEVAYLKSVESPWDQKIDPTNKRVKIFTKKEMMKKFGGTDFEILSYTKSGYVDKVIINQKEFTGREIREKLNLASSSFQIEFTSKGYQFTTLGSGHGVGMSQYGAQGMAKENKSYKDILHHYYKNIEIISI